ncbi:hypothetical protein Leryth_012340 [Lithospermum erythrorhizon]|nr:hypothetical protein Leryth_012340 [Lithospermum erythrorhizon]
MVYPTNPIIQEAFTAFFVEWHVELQSLLENLQALSTSIASGTNRAKECENLATNVVNHFHEFYNKKSQFANEDVFLFFSAPWLSSFEHTLLWISGFRPSLVFTLVNRLGESLSIEQREVIESLKAETRRKEVEIEKALAKVQERVAAPPIFELMRRESRLVDGEVPRLEMAMEEFKGSMVLVMEHADGLRGSTVMRLFEILDSEQIIKFFTTATEFMLEARRWGLERDSTVTYTASTT